MRIADFEDAALDDAIAAGELNDFGDNLRLADSTRRQRIAYPSVHVCVANLTSRMSHIQGGEHCQVPDIPLVTLGAKVQSLGMYRGLPQ